MSIERRWLSGRLTVSADASEVLYLAMPEAGEWRLVDAPIITPMDTSTGHASNYADITAKKGLSGTTIFSWSTDSDVSGQGTLTAGTPVEMVAASGGVGQNLEFTGGVGGDVLEITVDATPGTGVAVDAHFQACVEKIRG